MGIPWRRKWQPTPGFLPGESCGQRSHGQRSPRGCEESGTAEGTKHSPAHTKFGGILCVVLSSLKTNFHVCAEFRKSSLLVIKNCGEHIYSLLTSDLTQASCSSAPQNPQHSHMCTYGATPSFSVTQRWSVPCLLSLCTGVQRTLWRISHEVEVPASTILQVFVLPYTSHPLKLLTALCTANSFSVLYIFRGIPILIYLLSFK